MWWLRPAALQDYLGVKPTQNLAYIARAWGHPSCGWAVCGPRGGGMFGHSTEASPCRLGLRTTH
eukprot:12568535-Alexandrium_andersonii.AAC.1